MESDSQKFDQNLSQGSHKKSKKGNKLLTIGVILMMLAGIALMSYPTVADWWNQRTARYAIAEYKSQTDALDQDIINSMIARARAYNDMISKDKARWTPTEAQTKEYYQCLNVSGTGIIATIEIPSIHVNLPVYHGDSDAVLQTATGHIEGSSLPTGDKGTHTVISGHIGLPSAKLFTKLDTLKEGDRFIVHVLNMDFEYEVDNIAVVLPYEFELLDIDPNEDQVTLLTCTPYGVNTHRLLVRGTRVNTTTTEASGQVCPLASVVATDLCVKLALQRCFDFRPEAIDIHLLELLDGFTKARLIQMCLC